LCNSAELAWSPPSPSLTRKETEATLIFAPLHSASPRLASPRNFSPSSHPTHRVSISLSPSSPILILDPNIDETGNQLFKSNNGPKECCYEYCTNGDGLCSSSCEQIFISNHTAITPNNSTNRTQSKINLTPNLFVKLDNGTVILNDYTRLPVESAMTCPVLPNITQSTQRCSISQAQAASSATSLSSSSLAITSLISVFIQQLITYLASYLHLKSPVVGYIVAALDTSHWSAMLLWNSLPLYVLRRTTQLQHAAGL
jgi:hypothetical protein